MHTSLAQAAANDDLIGTATTRTVAFEAVDADGNTYMQEVDASVVTPAAKAKSRPTVPVFPLGPKPEVRVAPPAVGQRGAER